MIKTVTCVVIRCDTCGDGWTGDDDYGTPFFDTPEQAVEHANANGWLTTTTRAICPPCTRIADCEATGHQWQPWSTIRTTQAGQPYRHRGCGHCLASDYDPPYEALAAIQAAAKVITDAASNDNP